MVPRHGQWVAVGALLASLVIVASSSVTADHVIDCVDCAQDIVDHRGNLVGTYAMTRVHDCSGGESTANWLFYFFLELPFDELVVDIEIETLGDVTALIAQESMMFTRDNLYEASFGERTRSWSETLYVYDYTTISVAAWDSMSCSILDFMDVTVTLADVSVSTAEHVRAPRGDVNRVAGRNDDGLMISCTSCASPFLDNRGKLLGVYRMLAQGYYYDTRYGYEYAAEYEPYYAGFEAVVLLAPKTSSVDVRVDLIVDRAGGFSSFVEQQTASGTVVYRSDVVVGERDQVITKAFKTGNVLRVVLLEDSQHRFRRQRASIQLELVGAFVNMGSGHVQADVPVSSRSNGVPSLGRAPADVNCLGCVVQLLDNRGKVAGAYATWGAFARPVEHGFVTIGHEPFIDNKVILLTVLESRVKQALVEASSTINAGGTGGFAWLDHFIYATGDLNELEYLTGRESVTDKVNVRTGDILHFGYSAQDDKAYAAPDTFGHVEFSFVNLAAAAPGHVLAAGEGITCGSEMSFLHDVDGAVVGLVATSADLFDCEGHGSFRTANRRAGSESYLFMRFFTSLDVMALEVSVAVDVSSKRGSFLQWKHQNMEGGTISATPDFDGEYVEDVSLMVYGGDSLEFSYHNCCRQTAGRGDAVVTVTVTGTFLYDNV